MAGALARGILSAGLVKPDEIIASDPIEAARKSFSADTGAKTTAENEEVVRKARTIFLSVKPHQVESVLRGVQNEWSASHLLISIAAGVPLARLEGALPSEARVVRVMPNTPALVGASAAAFAPGQHATAEDGALVEKLLSSVGIVFPLKESLLDAVTGLSGSGPAYGYLMIEALSDGGVAAGLPRDVAIKLAAQTLLGSAKMVLETGFHPGTLKDMVTSPGGTTIDGVHELEKGGFRGTVMNAVRAAAEKSKLLGNG